MKRVILLVCATLANVIAQCPNPCATVSPLPLAPVALPSCNCPTIPSLPVSPCTLPAINAPPFGAPYLSGFAPLGMINPFLPAASPISALAPTVSSLYPPINPCNCGCKYLKKIPIPPPCL